MSSAVRFDDDVALVTGAASGLGREIALQIADRGGHVVLVDRVAPEDTVRAIREKGGKAEALAADLLVPHEGRRIVEATLERHGRVDVLSLGAGALRDRSFAKLTEEDMEAILRLHFLAPFESAHAAWPAMRAQGAGRILFFTSHAALYGNFGQANYAAAKSALIGLMRCLAIEGERVGVRANALAPLAATPLAAGTPIEGQADRLRPSDAAATAVFLCWRHAEVTDRIVSAAGACVALSTLVEGPPVSVAPPGAATPEAVASSWRKIADSAPEAAAPDCFAAVKRLADAAAAGGPVGIGAG